MNQVKTNKISKYALSLIAVAALSCSSLSFGMDIFQAIEKKDIKRAEEILKDKSFDVNKADKDGRTPLYWACYKNYPEIVKLLLDKGAEKSVNKADKDGGTPLCCACCNNNLEIVTLLLANGAKESINKVDKLFGRTPLYWACYKNYLEIVKLLLDKGAEKSVNIADNYGWTPLNWACYINNLELVTLLLASGADVDQKSLNKAQGKPEILKLLKERSSIKK